MRTLWLTVALLAVSLSGCTGDDPTNDELDAGPIAVGGAGGTNVTLPGAHAHNVWAGKDRITVLDTDAGSMDVCTGCPWAYLGAFRLPPGEVIPQGTRFVDVTPTFTLQGASGPMHVWVQTAADRILQEVGTVESGATLRVEVNNTQNDLGHTNLSAWRFLLAARADSVAAGLGQVYQTQGHVTIDAVRGLEIPDEPAHPDLWGNDTRIPLLAADVGPKITLQNSDGETRGCILFGCPATHVPDDRVVVPYDATAVEVTLRYDATLPQPWQELAYHGNDHWTHEHAEPTETGPGFVRYVIPVDGNSDSPYAKQSVWSFRVVWDQDSVDATDNRRPHPGGYSIEAVAVKS